MTVAPTEPVVPAARPAASRRPPGRRAVWSSCVLVPAVVLAPLSTHPFWADHRLSIYGYGGVYLNRPWRLPVDALGAVPYFLSVGNFRPLGRIYEWSLDVLVFALVDLVGLPANVGLRLVGLAAAVLLCLAAVRLTAAVTARGSGPPSVAVALTPYAVGAGFVAAGRTSTTVLFSGLYLTTSALVLAVAAWACRFVGAPTLRRRWQVLAVLAGAGVAGFNELACLAVPLATVAVLLRGRLRSAGLRDPGLRFAALLWAGFLPVFLPVRAVIRANCAGGGCYEGSDMALTDAAATLPSRLVSGLPPLMWQWAVQSRPWPVAVAVLALIVLLVPAWRLARTIPGLPVLDRREALTLAGVAAAVVVLAAAVGSLNVWVQQDAAAGRYGMGWRDSGLTAAGSGVLVVAVVATRRRWAAVLGMPVLLVTAALSTAANAAHHDGAAAERLPYLHNRIAQEMADFDPTAAGDARRCALRAAYLSTTSAANEPRIDQILDVAADRVAGRRFCGAAPVRRGPVPLYRPS